MSGTRPPPGGNIGGRPAPGGSVGGIGGGRPSGSVNALFNNKAKKVKELHVDDDVDSDLHAHHHTLGYKRNQAAPGKPVKRLLESGHISHSSDGTQNITTGGAAQILLWPTVVDAGVNINYTGGGVFSFDKEGYYKITVMILLSSSAVGRRQVSMTWQDNSGVPVNKTVGLINLNASSAGAFSITFSSIDFYARPGDFVWASCFQDSGANRAVQLGSQISIHRIRD